MNRVTESNFICFNYLSEKMDSKGNELNPYNVNISLPKQIRFFPISFEAMRLDTRPNVPAEPTSYLNALWMN